MLICFFFTFVCAFFPPSRFSSEIIGTMGPIGRPTGANGRRPSESSGSNSRPLSIMIPDLTKPPPGMHGNNGNHAYDHQNVGYKKLPPATKPKPGMVHLDPDVRPKVTSSRCGNGVHTGDSRKCSATSRHNGQNGNHKPPRRHAENRRYKPASQSSQSTYSKDMGLNFCNCTCRNPRRQMNFLQSSLPPRLTQLYDRNILQLAVAVSRICCHLLYVS